MCGLALLRTIDQGKLSHDDAVTKHLPPEYLDAISTPPTRKLLDHLTIAHLISHTGGTTVSGFPGYDCNGPAPPSVLSILRGDYGSNTPQIRLSRLPGLKWRYSGGGTTILHAILESIHQKSLSQIVHELVFEPFRMQRTFYNDILPKGEDNFAKCFDTGITESRPARWHIQPELGAAGVWTTPADLLKAQRGIRDAALGRDNFLGQELAMKGLTALEGANGFGYGGWVNGQNWFGHDGSNFPGFRCRTLTCFDSDGDGRLGNAEGEGVAVMTNSAMGIDVCLKITQAIAYLRGWPGREVLGLHGMDHEGIPLMVPTGEIDENWKQWKGNWVVGVEDDDLLVKEGQIFEILEEEGQPCIKLDGLPSMKLVKAAMPAVACGNHGLRALDLVVEGLDMMITLRYAEGGQRVMQVWPGMLEQPIDCASLR